MKYANIPYVDKQVSRIFYGVSGPLFSDGQNQDALLDAMFDLGINAFDCARNYGLSEKSLGMWLKHSGKREESVILSKCGHHDVDTLKKRVSREEMYDDLNVSLDLLDIEKIDIYILHRDDETVPVGVVMDTLNEMHEAGKIGAFGASNWTHQRMQAANDYAKAHGLIPMTAASPNFGLARQVEDPWGGSCVSIAGPENEAARAWYKENSMSTIAYSSIGRGFFSGKVKSDDPSTLELIDRFARKGYECPDNIERLARCEELAKVCGASVSQIALAYLFASGLDAYAIVSTGNPERMKENIGALDIDLTAAQAAYLDLRADTY